MKILTVSDLHLDASRMDISPCGADLVILAGDITFEDYNWDWLLNKLNGAKIIFVPGNHDFDNRDYQKLEEQTNDIFKDYEYGAYYLNNKSLIIDGIKFIGTTLWSDFSFGTSHLTEKMKNDIASLMSSHVKYITYNNRPMNYLDIIEEHKKSRKFLEYELKNNRQSDIVHTQFVITHFAPHEKSISEQYKLHHNCYHITDLSYLMGLSDFWLHGHMHDSFNYNIEGTKVFCNPRGFVPIFNLNQNGFFDKKMILEIKPPKPNKKINKNMV